MKRKNRKIKAIHKFNVIRTVFRWYLQRWNHSLGEHLLKVTYRKTTALRFAPVLRVILSSEVVRLWGLEELSKCEELKGSMQASLFCILIFLNFSRLEIVKKTLNLQYTSTNVGYVVLEKFELFFFTVKRRLKFKYLLKAFFFCL